MRIKKTFKDFIKESQDMESEFLDFDTIKDIFIDLIDMDFEIKNIDERINKDGKWYLDMRKVVDSKYDYIENNYSYGISNLEPMKVDVSKVIDILQDAKETLNSMEYTIGYEIEFHFNDQSQFFISCHIQHNDTIENDDDDDDDDIEIDFVPRGLG